jgi:hypothetical protein
VRKVKDRAAARLAKKRWAGTTAEERREELRKVWEARSAKAAARKAALAQATEEMIEA